LGTDKPDSTRLWRYFHNLYGLFPFTDKPGLTPGFLNSKDDIFLKTNESLTGTNTAVTFSAAVSF